MALPNQQAVDYPSFKIVILSPIGAGKKTFERRRRHVDGDNQMFVDPGTVYHIYFPTKRGGIRFICSDKDTELMLHARRAIEGSDGVIIMFDENSPTYSQASELIFNIWRDCPDIPIVLCRNRVDLRHIVNAMQFPGNIKYCEISGPSNYNIERPFLLLAMMLVSPSISFMEEMAHLVPPQDLPNQQIADNPSFKIVILGPAGAGKTTFVERHVDGDKKRFDDPYTGVTVHPMDFGTNLGRFRLNCWVPTGLSQDGGRNLKKRYNWEGEISRALKGAHGAIIMFDVNEESPYDHINELFLIIDRVCSGIPIVLCGNKVDLQNRNVNAELLAKWLDGNTQYCEISALSNYKLKRPFLFLARMLVRYDIMFTERPALVPPEVIIDFEALRRNEREFFGALYRAYDLMQALMPFA